MLNKKGDIMKRFAKAIVFLTLFALSTNSVRASQGDITVYYYDTNVAVQNENYSSVVVVSRFDQLDLSLGEMVPKYSEARDSFFLQPDFGHGFIFYYYQIDYFDIDNVIYLDDEDLSYDMITSYRNEEVKEVLSFFGYAAKASITYSLENGDELKPALDIFGRVPYSFPGSYNGNGYTVGHSFEGDDIIIDTDIEGYELVSGNVPNGTKFTQEDQEINLVYKVKETIKEPEEPETGEGEGDTEPIKPPIKEEDKDIPTNEDKGENPDLDDTPSIDDLPSVPDTPEKDISTEKEDVENRIDNVLPATGLTSNMTKSIYVTGLGFLTVFLSERLKRK